MEEKKVLQSVALDCCIWPAAPVGFQTQPFPQRSPLPTEGPPVFDVERTNPPSYVRDPVVMLLQVQLL